MRVEYICHACLLIDTGDIRIITDPWFTGSAYCGQWHIFPKPIDTDILNTADVILISHGHEDHLHEESLRRLPQSARVFYPHTWVGGTKEYLRSLGFADVQEAVTYKTYRLSKKTSVTFIANTHDNIIVIESDGKVLVNANDALHSYPAPVMDFYLSSLRTEWPRIDVLFCGFGGASYFPNAIHIKGKNDWEVGKVREQFFAHNFCRIVSGLQPKVAVPFAADFALLSPDQRWINEVRFPRTKMKSYYERYFAKKDDAPLIFDMYPGDVLENYNLRPASPYRGQIKNDSLDHLIEEQYGEEMLRFQSKEFIREADAARLGEEIHGNIDFRAGLFDVETLDKLRFCLRVSDVASNNIYNIKIKDGRTQVERSGEPSEDCLLIMDTSSEILRHSFGNEWGGDAIFIGYGCEIQMLDRRAAEKNLDLISVNLLTRYPTTRSSIKKNPLRALEYVIRTPLRRALALRRLKPHLAEGVNFDRSTWLLRDQQEIRELCGLPAPDEELTPLSRRAAVVAGSFEPSES
jgi:beta-lactamase family protein